MHKILMNVKIKQESLSRAQNISVPPSSLNVENQRLLTFADWNQPKLDKTLMSQIGFYFIGPTDLVKCHFCKVEIGMWQSEDNPVEEHLRWSPNCPLLNGRETNNVPIDAEAIKRLLFSLNPAAFFPCGHIFACDKCALNFKTCPVCRHPITQSLKIYFT
uniref:CSON007021 protein n=1 Tax=Culicoides sonorensis TaxID=179676 RepID=A0A336KCF4_CULSO